MLRKLLSLVTCILLFSGAAFAQGTLTGTVTDSRTGETLPGVNVVIVELDRGAATNAQGEFTINNVPAGTYTLQATFIGFKRTSQEVEVGSGGEEVVNLTMEEDVFGLEEVVVTGVGVGTETTKLGFSVGKVSGRDLEEVPATDPGNALRAKIPGITVVQASGDPASSPTIRLRGSTSITGDQQPLIIVDGVITSGNLRDINMEDVESIEVVKGAAASSLYGSLAGNGVVQIITKRGSGTGGAPQITIRSEYGQSQLAKDYPLATKHPWPTDDIVLDESGQYIVEWPSYDNYVEYEPGEDNSDRLWDNDYPVLYDNVEALFTGQPYNSNYFSLANSSEDFSYMASFENLNQGGVLEPVQDYKRNTFRLNADYTPNDKFIAKFNASYIDISSPDFEGEELGQGDNPFYSALTAQPFINFLEKGDDGTYSNSPTGYDVNDSNFQNPLYVTQQRDRTFNRERIIAGAMLSYNVTDWLSVNGRQSLDKSYVKNEEFFPIGYQTPTPDATVNDGFDYRRSTEDYVAVTELWAEASHSFENFNITSTLKYLYEDRHEEWFEAEGSEYVTQGIRDIGSLDADTYNIDSYIQDIRVENIILTADVDYKDKLILGGVIRRDGSSGFGSEERWQTYYRGSLAYRITEDLDINNVQEWKVRASYGVGGQRPPFEAQYETYEASATGISPDVLGNNEIRPSTVAELEFGTNVAFLDRFNFEANYSFANTEDDYLLVPLSSVAGFVEQWQNIGEIESTSLEFALAGQILRTQDMSWNFNITWDKTTQEITDLGDVPPFTRDVPGVDEALPLFRIEKGVPYGAIYGNQVLTSLDQLTTGPDGNVLNEGIDTNSDGQLTRDDYEINQHGYVVPAGTHGTPDEQVIYQVDENAEKEVTNIGNVTPDFKMGFSTNFNWKGIGLYALLDWTQGGDIYNFTKQLLYFNSRHKDLQEFGSQGFDPQYSDASSNIYNLAAASSYFVEDGTYLKLREVALSYTLGAEKLGQLGAYLDEIKIGISGRNLLTFTDYTGFDPEVALRVNSTNYRLDEYAYPNYRTYSASIQVKF